MIIFSYSVTSAKSGVGNGWWLTIIIKNALGIRTTAMIAPIIDPRSSLATHGTLLLYVCNLQSTAWTNHQQVHACVPLVWNSNTLEIVPSHRPATPSTARSTWDRCLRLFDNDYLLRICFLPMSHYSMTYARSRSRPQPNHTLTVVLRHQITSPGQYKRWARSQRWTRR